MQGVESGVLKAQFQEIVSRALVATGSPRVHMSMVEAETGLVRVVASASAEGPLHLTTDAIRRLLPRFDPDRVVLARDVNPVNREVFLEGKPVWATLSDAARNVVPNVVLVLARRFLGTRHVYVCPLHLQGKVVGSITFHVAADHLLDNVRFTCDAFTAQVNLILEREVLKQEVMHDPLTGAYNRRFLVGEGAQALTAAREAGTTMSLIFLDLDRFKTVNDTYGHAAGDDILRALVDRCRTVLRPNDPLVRYGGDEFAVLLSGMDLDRASQVAERLRHAVAAEPIPTVEGALPVAISLGVAQWDGETPDLDWLLRQASAALAPAKKAGGNCTRMA